jgi:hypothetical protein
MIKETSRLFLDFIQSLLSIDEEMYSRCLTDLLLYKKMHISWDVCQPFMVLFFSKLFGNCRISLSLMLLMIIVHLAQCCSIFQKKSSPLFKIFQKKTS